MGHAGGAPTASDHTVVMLPAFLARYTGLVLGAAREPR